MTMDKEVIQLCDIPDITGQSLSVVHDAINAGHLRTFVVGRRRFARPAAIKKWIDYLQARSDAGTPVSYRQRAQESQEPKGVQIRTYLLPKSKLTDEDVRTSIAGLKGKGREPT